MILWGSARAVPGTTDWHYILMLEHGWVGDKRAFRQTNLNAWYSFTVHFLLMARLEIL